MLSSRPAPSPAENSGRLPRGGAGQAPTGQDCNEFAPLLRTVIYALRFGGAWIASPSTAWAVSIQASLKVG